MTENRFTILTRFASSIVAVIVFLISPSVNGLTDGEAVYRDIPFYDDVVNAQTCDPNFSGGSLERYLQVLASNESGGNPTAANPAGGAYGKYQYIQSTWQSVASTYYPPATQFATANLAPEEVQDAVAYLEYSVKFKTFNGDVFKMAVSHYYPAANENPALLDQIPAPEAGNTKTPREYAELVIGQIKDGVGADIPLKHSSAPDFQTHLAAIGGLPGSSSGTVSAVGSCGVPAESFVFYSQYDPEWRNHPFGTSTVGPSGCGPTSVAMVVATLVDKTIKPPTVADFGTQNDAYIEGSGSDWQKMLVEGPQNWGLNVESLNTDMDAAIRVLRAGGLVLASGSGPVPFTQGGHIIVLRGITADGKILVGDPAHEEANETEYSTTDLLKSIEGMWGVTK